MWFAAWMLGLAVISAIMTCWIVGPPDPRRRSVRPAKPTHAPTGPPPLPPPHGRGN